MEWVTISSSWGNLPHPGIEPTALASAVLADRLFTSESPGMKVKEESGKAGLKLNIQKTTVMASGPITSWEIDGETVETVSDFIFWAPKSLQVVTAAMKLKDAYSLEGKL